MARFGTVLTDTRLQSADVDDVSVQEGLERTLWALPPFIGGNMRDWYIAFWIFDASERVFWIRVLGCKGTLPVDNTCEKDVYGLRWNTAYIHRPLVVSAEELDQSI